MKKSLVMIIGIVCISIVGWFIFGNKKEITNGMEERLFGRNLIVDAKTDVMPDLASIENKAEMIVIGKKVVQENPTVIYNQEDRIDVAYTLSNFLVQKVISGDEVQSGMEITILENEAYNKREDITYHIAGYELMKEDNEYLLFLRKSTTDPYYIIIGNNYGKVPLQNETSALREAVQKANTSYATEKLSEWAREDKVKQQALEKYASYLD
ncbi:hypothetical protein R6U77_09750 [Lysinibacillus louembei]|uniref:SAF domain-containing protein n=1 Tax=Lysinibacillus louembei TaxID=1470088 RepID=A0ABZ0S6B3_9BACI|nr:hypothetical protein [Lysinibacillus louembei]WPK13907.1 hypothetical protein R6U77_09750 [Lysinibacillus louembei]